MKALILSGGKGTRLSPLTNTLAKQLVPVANKPVLFYVLEQVTEAGIKDIGIIISPETGSQIREALGNGSKWNSRITYIPQAEPLGLSHAVKTAQDFLGKSAFLMFLGDTLIQSPISRFVEQFSSGSADALILLKAVQDTHLFGVAELDGAGRLCHVEEKPKHPRSNLAVVGAYFFSASVHEAIAQITPSWRGELEITDAIQQLIDTGKRVEHKTLDGWWFDIGNKNSLLEANRVILDDFLIREIKGNVDDKSLVEGKIEVRQESRIVNSVIQGPVSIAEGCQITDSRIGPFTSIGGGTVIQNSYIENSIILGQCQISNLGHLTDSIIGERTRLTRQSQNDETLKLFLGFDARVEL